MNSRIKLMSNQLPVNSLFQDQRWNSIYYTFSKDMTFLECSRLVFYKDIILWSQKGSPLYSMRGYKIHMYTKNKY